MGAFAQDLQYGVRQLGRQRGSTAVAVITLAVGIGAASALFSIVDATLLRPLPYPDPEQLVEVVVEVPQADGKRLLPTPSLADLRAVQAVTDVLSHAAGVGAAFGGSIVDGEAPERVRVRLSTEDYLSMHGVAPILGRDFTIEDTHYGSPAVVLLGYGFWQSRYAGRSDVVGETIRFDDVTATIIGVLPPSFESGTPVVRAMQVPPEETLRRGTGRLSIYGRLQPGVTLQSAADRLSGHLASEAPHEALAGMPARAVVISRLDTSLAASRTTVAVMSGAVALVLLIACLNVAGLLAARGSARQSELALRTTLGASRVRLVRQLLTESALLAAAGALVGIFLAWISLRTIVASLPLSMPVDSPVSLNLRVLLATVAILVPTVLAFGLFPAIQLSHVRLAPSLARGRQLAGSVLSRRTGQSLIAAETALAIVLLIGAGLMLRSFARLTSADLGFEPDRLVTMEVLPLDPDPEVRSVYYRTLLHNLRAIEGVQSAGIVDNFPLSSGTGYTAVSGSGGRAFSSAFEMTAGYLETIGARLRAGRFLTEAEFTSGFRGVVLNETAARAIFDGAPAVGREIRRGGDPQPWTVLGIIGDIRHGGPLGRRGEHFPQAFFPLDPAGEAHNNMAMVVALRYWGSADGLAERLRHLAQAVGPRVLVEDISTADERFAEVTATPRRRTVLLGLLGALGVVLALVGVFGVTAYAVSHRTAEIGVRIAVGAPPSVVVRAILGDALAPLAVGVIIGIGGAYFATRLIQSFLFQTTATDPLTFVVVAR